MLEYLKGKVEILPGRKLHVTASALCNTTGYTFKMNTQTEGSRMTVRVHLEGPPPGPSGGMTGHAFTSPTMDETLDIPDGVTEVLFVQDNGRERLIPV